MSDDFEARIRKLEEMLAEVTRLLKAQMADPTCVPIEDTVVDEDGALCVLRHLAPSGRRSPSATAA